MRLSVVRLGVLLVASCLLPAGASAQAPAIAPPQPGPLRSQISIMEGILERAVGVGISSTVNQMPELFPPGGPGVWVTPPRARGFVIEGYGVFFDVEVPGLPPTIWSMDVLMRSNETVLVNELSELRTMIAQAVPEGPKRVELTRRLDSLEARVSGAPLSEAAPGAAPAGTNRVSERVTLPPDRTTGRPGAPAGGRALPVRDPNAVYTTEVQRALTDVLLRNAITVEVPAEQWITIAASESRSGAVGEPQTQSLYLSIQGKDLTALRTNQITPQEAAKRIITKYY